jgi:hypothetical protein
MSITLTIPSQQVLSISPSVFWNDVDGELVLFHSDDGSYHALNGVGSAIWRAIANGRELNHIILDLCSTYNQDETVIEAEVQGFIQRVHEKGLLISQVTSL